MWPTGLRAGARETLAAKRLDADHRTDEVAVHVSVADMQAGGNALDRFVDAAVNAQCQPCLLYTSRSV